MKTGFVNEIEHHLAALCIVPKDVNLPAIQQGQDRITETGMVVLRNGLINLGNLRTGQDIELQPHSPQVVSRVCLPYDYDAFAQCPQWVTFLEQILPDADSRQLLQQVFGYCLTYDVSQQKFFMFEGFGGNGKGVVTNILTRLLAPENVSALSLHRFGGTHDLIVTVGKLVNIMSELKATDKVAEHILKQFTGGDAITFNPKYQAPFSAKPTAKIILSGNERPGFTDRSNGLWRRLIILPFPVTIAEDERNVNLEEELAAELSGILNWAIVGAKSLYTAGRFLEPMVSVEAHQTFRKEMNPAALFLEEHCTADPQGYVLAKGLYQKYAQFCQDYGYKPLNEGNLSKEVPGVFKGVKKTRRYIGKSRPHVYQGITITSKVTGQAYVEPTRQAPQGAKERHSQNVAKRLS